jgi:xanthine dehydrogenase YagS FAD-binding subunit
MDHIKEEEAVLRIGALAKLDQIATSPIVNEKYNALAQAARSVGSPQIRNMGTIGGNLCQDVRCCYYRASPWCGPSFICLRKGGRVCYAVTGDNRYHSIFGGKKGCFAVCPSDMAPALVALNAQVKTSKRTAKLEELFHHSTCTILDTDEIVTEIVVPNPSGGTKSTYIKFALRKAVDFAIVSVALVLTVNGGACEDVKIVLGGVAPNPWRPKAVEDSIQGKSIDERIAEAASAATVAKAIVLSDNRYKVHIAKTLVKRALLACI